MSIRFTFVSPTPLNKDAFKKSFEKANKDTANACKKDYEAITEKWKPEHKPKFRARTKASADVLSWGIEVTGKGAEIFGYWIWGTKPHLIRVRKKKALHWVSSTPIKTGFSPWLGGRMEKGAFAKEVHHPGTKGNEKVLDELRKKYERVFTDNASKAMSEAVEKSNHRIRR